MNVRTPVTADDLDLAISCVTDGLRAAEHEDWSVRAGSLEWSCRLTADHLVHCSLMYAAQLASRAPHHYVRLVSRAQQETSNADLLEAIEAAGRVLAMVIRAAPADARAFHPSGMADPEGFAGMGCIELLLHGWDIAAGLGCVVDPPRDVCARVLARMFPQHGELLAANDLDSWTALRWATGRSDVPGLGHVDDWTWHGSPLVG